VRFRGDDESVGFARPSDRLQIFTGILLEILRSADGLMLGPTATFDFRDESRGEINPSKFFRKNLDLFANIRPAKPIPVGAAPSVIST
jgi:isocitrate/isopropylmalate dehydrogenase